MPELIAAYPDAKVIVCERPADRWFESLQQTIFKSLLRWQDLPLGIVDTEFFRPFGSMMIHLDALFGGNLRDPARAKAAYRAYHAEVRGLVPAGARRLDYQLADGAEPLCKVLGREPPKGVDIQHDSEDGTV